MSNHNINEMKFRGKLIGHHAKRLVKSTYYFLRAVAGHTPEPKPSLDVEEVLGHGPSHPSQLCKCPCTYTAHAADHEEGCLWLAQMCLLCEGWGQCPACLGDGTKAENSVDPMRTLLRKAVEAAVNSYLGLDLGMARYDMNRSEDTPEHADRVTKYEEELEKFLDIFEAEQRKGKSNAVG